MKIKVNTIPEALSKAYKKYSSKPAMYLNNGNKISYDDMMWDVTATCSVLKNNGIGKDKKVALFIDNCPQCVETFLAISKLGAVAVLLDYTFSREQIAEILKAEKPDLIFVSDYKLDMVLGSAESTILGIDDNRILKQVTNHMSKTFTEIAEVSENDNVVITYTLTETEILEKHCMTQKAFIAASAGKKKKQPAIVSVSSMVCALKNMIAPIIGGFTLRTSV